MAKSSFIKVKSCTVFTENQIKKSQSVTLYVLGALFNIESILDLELILQLLIEAGTFHNIQRNDELLFK